MYVNICHFPEDDESSERAHELAAKIKEAIKPEYRFVSIFVTKKEGHDDD